MMARQYFTIISFFLFVFSAQAQVQYVPMFELFTNASCTPCADQQMGYDNMLDQYKDRIAALEYHYTPDDEMDILAEQENVIPLRRKNFYEQKIKSIPAMVIGGTTWPGRAGAPKDLTAAMVDASLSMTSLVSLDVSHSINLNKDSIFVDIHIANDSPDKFLGKDVYVYVALIEKQIQFNSPIGSNGQMQFRNVVRKMLPSYVGKSIGRNILSGRTLDFNFNSTIPNYIYDLNKLGVVAWLQHTKEKVVYQCGESAPIDFTATSEIANPLSFVISPNPATENIGIHFEFSHPQQTIVSLLDINGNRIVQIWEGTAQKNTIKYATSKLSSGTYFIRCQTPEKTQIKKLLVMK